VTGRVLVTVRCRRKGHVLAELSAGVYGQRVLRMHHHSVLSIERDGQVRQVRLPPGLAGGPPLTWEETLSGPRDTSNGPYEPWPVTDPDGIAIYPVACACGRPHLVSVADLAAAAASGEPVVIAAPMR
jgi:hypothetical protein